MCENFWTVGNTIHVKITMVKFRHHLNLGSKF